MSRTSPDHLAAWLAFAGAIIVAVVAASTAQWRLRVTTKAEQRRLDSQLRAEHRRHQERLEHERKLNDLQELREVLDGASAEIPQLVRACSEVAKLSWDEQRRTDRMAVLTAATSLLMTATSQSERVAARLGREHRVTKLYEETVDHASATFSHYSKLATQDGQSQRVDKVGDLKGMPEFQAAANAFADAVFETVGSRP